MIGDDVQRGVAVEVGGGRLYGGDSEVASGGHRVAPAIYELARSDESVSRVVLAQRLFDLGPDVGLFIAVQRTEHLMQRSKRFAFEAHAVGRRGKPNRSVDGLNDDVVEILLA